MRQNLNEAIVSSIIEKASGLSRVDVKEIQSRSDSSGLDVLLITGEAWTIEPGPMWQLTVTGPDGVSKLIEWKESKNIEKVEDVKAERSSSMSCGM